MTPSTSAPQQHALASDTSRREPPRQLKGTFGFQPYSTRSTAPTYSFSKAKPEQKTAVYLGKDFSAREYVSCAPGPGTYKPSSTLTSVEEPSNCRWAASSSGRQVFSKRQFSSSKSVPGPGAYEQLPGLNRTWHSSLETDFKLGPKRFGNKVFLSSEHAAHEQKCRDSPGPATLGQDFATSCGRQADSRKSTSPGFTLSRTRKFFTPKGRDTEGTPGPGMYNYY